MRLRKILVCMKRTLVERKRRHRDFIDALKRQGRGSGAFKPIFDSHIQTLNARRNTLNILDNMGISYDVLTRPQAVDEKAFDLVIVVGGDGTMLDYSRYIENLPILGVNSSPDSSVGRFHYTDVSGLEKVINRIRENALIPTKLIRLRLVLDGRVLPVPVLNEVLFAHKNPAATSRYIIKLDGKQEVQRSSGVWVATPAGSSGAILSAGGKLQNPDDKHFQYIVREPFRSPLNRYEMTLTGGFIQGNRIEFVSRSFDAAVFIDGMRGMYDVGYWSHLTVDTMGPDLLLFLREL